AYLRKGKSVQAPLYPHSTEMVALSETGLVGALLLFGAFGTLLVAALRAVRRTDLTGVVAGAGILMFGYWLLHSSVDWFWEFPALAGSALAALGIAAAVAREAPAQAPPPERSRPALASALALVAGLAGLVL